MRKLWLLTGFIFLSGCLTRTYTIEKPRTDLVIEGNQGYLVGTPPPLAQEKKLKNTRLVSVMEIELGSHRLRQPQQQNTVSSASQAGFEGSSNENIETVKPQISPQGNYQSYTIQKGDTLQKISKKFYGTTKKWNFLYEANKDILKSPDKVYLGTEIKIPTD